MLEENDIANILPKITDFGAAWRLDALNPEGKPQNEAVYTYPIQPNYYRAPEVVLGYGWNFSADIWNFGVLVVTNNNLRLHSYLIMTGLEYHRRHGTLHSSRRFAMAI